MDKTISPRYMRSDHQRQSIHYFHMYAALDRVNAVDLPADHLVGDISTTPLSAFLPSPADCKVLRANYAVLLGRIVVKKLAFFKVFEDCVVNHITHKHSDVMKQKSVIVSIKTLRWDMLGGSHGGDYYKHIRSWTTKTGIIRHNSEQTSNY